MPSSTPSTPSYLPASGTVSTCEPTTNTLASCRSPRPPADHVADASMRTSSPGRRHPRAQMLVNVPHRRTEERAGQPARLLAAAGEDVAAVQHVVVSSVHGRGPSLRRRSVRCTMIRLRRKQSDRHYARPLRFYLNGRPQTIRGEAAFESLTDFLRGRLGLAGTKVVCAEGDCGACTVLVGRPASDRLQYAAGRFVHPVLVSTRRHARRHRRGVVAQRRTAPGPAGDGRLPRLAVRLLHAGDS